MSRNIGHEDEYDVHWLIYPDVVCDSAEAVFILIGRKVGRYVYGSVLYPCIAQQRHTSCVFISRTSYKSPRVLAAPGLREVMSHGANSWITCPKCSPAVQPDTPWFIAFACICCQGTVRRLECPEKERVVRVPFSLHANVAREATLQRPCHVRQRLGDLEVYRSLTSIRVFIIVHCGGTTYNSAKTRHNRPLACPGTHAANCSWSEPGQPRVAGWQQPPRRSAALGESLRGSCRQSGSC